MYIDNNNQVEKEANVLDATPNHSHTKTNTIQKSNTSDFLVKPSNYNIRKNKNRYSNMHRKDNRTNSVNIENLNFRFKNLDTMPKNEETKNERILNASSNKLSIREGHFVAEQNNSDYENKTDSPDIADQSEWEKLNENQKTNENMIEGLKKQIDSLSKQLEHIGKEDSKIINDLSVQVEHLAKMNYVI